MLTRNTTAAVVGGHKPNDKLGAKKKALAKAAKSGQKAVDKKLTKKLAAGDKGSTKKLIPGEKDLAKNPATKKNLTMEAKRLSKAPTTQEKPLSKEPLAGGTKTIENPFMAEKIPGRNPGEKTPNRKSSVHKQPGKEPPEGEKPPTTEERVTSAKLLPEEPAGGVNVNHKDETKQEDKNKDQKESAPIKDKHDSVTKPVKPPLAKNKLQTEPIKKVIDKNKTQKGKNAAKTLPKNSVNPAG